MSFDTAVWPFKKGFAVEAAKELDAAKQEELSADEARKVLELETQKRIKACSEAIDAVLKKHNCRIEPHLVVTGQGNQFGMRVVPIAEKQ